MRNRIVSLMTVFGLVLLPPLTQAQNDKFTVADSIQMVHFNEPTGNPMNPPVWRISPDGSELSLVTSKGLVQSDEIESTLWTLDLRSLELHLRETTQSTPSPKEVLTVRGQLRAEQGDSYGSLITDVQWSTDSQSIYLLAEVEGGCRELQELDLTTGHRRTLSLNRQNVTKFAVDPRGVVYSAEQLRVQSASGSEINSDVVDTVRGRSIHELLWPSQNHQTSLFRSDRDGVRAIAPSPRPGDGDETFSVSPDGSKVVAMVPVDKTPASWSAYVSGVPDRPLYRMEPGFYPLREYELIDLRTNLRKPLLGSPSGSLVGYHDAPQIVWSSKGDHLIVTNTFLPFEPQSSGPPTAKVACGAAYVRLSDGMSQCIVLARSSNLESADSWAIHTIQFGQSDNDVVVHLSWRGRHQTECYSLVGPGWEKLTQGACETIAKPKDGVNSSRVRLELRQDLNHPPTLWASERGRSVWSKIWDPNAEINSELSENVSEYSWLDKEKRTWRGGLVLPRGFLHGTRYPLVIQTHGFRPNEFLVDGVWTTGMAARPLADAGFVVLQVEDKHERNQTQGEATLHVQGYLAAIDKLAEDGLIDPRRVGIIGFSRTSWYVEESLLEAPDRFAAAVIADGYDASYIQYMLQRPDLPALETERYSGGLPIGSALASWITSAPDFRLSALRTPLRIQAIGPYSLLWEWEIYASLKLQNKPVDMLYLPLGQHVLQNPNEIMASEQGDVDWFRYWLKGEKDGATEKKKQYERWAALRIEARQETHDSANNGSPSADNRTDHN